MLGSIKFYFYFIRLNFIVATDGQL